jgi:hypothetical protein
LPKTAAHNKIKNRLSMGCRFSEKILHRLEFRWKKCFRKRKFLIERPDIVKWRASYLQKIKVHLNEGREM